MPTPKFDYIPRLNIILKDNSVISICDLVIEANLMHKELSMLKGKDEEIPLSRSFCDESHEK